MKFNIFTLFVTTLLLLTSCAEKAKICKLDKVYINEMLTVQFTYQGDELIQADLYDSAGYAGKYTYTHDGNGIISSVSQYYGAGDTLSYTNLAYITNDHLDSVQNMVDTTGDNVADMMNITWIYHYTGDKITSVDYRYPNAATGSYLTYIWIGNNISEVHYTGSNYYVYTFSDIKEPLTQYQYMDNLVSEPGPVPMNENMATHRDKYNSSNVLQTSIDYQPSNIDNGVQMFTPSTNITSKYILACTEM
jgi:hypothetical protein